MEKITSTGVKRHITHSFPVILGQPLCKVCSVGIIRVLPPDEKWEATRLGWIGDLGYEGNSMWN